MIIKVDDLDVNVIRNIEKLKKKKGTKKKINYADIITAFDIETTNIDSIRNSVMYVWQFQLGKDITIIGRKWEDFQKLYSIINDNLNDELVMVCYIHNLSFEFQFLKSVIPVDSVRAMDNRKVLSFMSGKLEFRCSYLHSNMSLDKYLEKMGVQHKKVHGFDYSKKRYYWTKLSDDEMEYIVNDVLGLVEGLEIEMKKDSDDLYSIPKTSTGYIRRKSKKALEGYGKYIKPMIPNLKTIEKLQLAFRGGNTHTNRFFAEKIVDSKIIGYPMRSKDVSSAYIYHLLQKRYPKEFVETPIRYFEDALRIGRACLFTIDMFNVRLADKWWGIPYIAKDKCIVIDGEEMDNGRVLSCNHCRMVITEQDFSIIKSEYLFDYEISDLMTAKKGLLPYDLRKMILEMYKEKTLLKGGDDYLYGKYKNMLNSTYGMTVQNPLKPNYEFRDGILIERDDSLDDLMKEYEKLAWLPYQWGVYTTAYQRVFLEKGLNCISSEQFLYADTDSIYYIDMDNDTFDLLNDKVRDDNLGAIDKKGKIHYLGIWEDDKKDIKRFISLGAKKYAFEDPNGVHLTVSGVNKKLGAKELGCLENFKEGFIFKDSGGTESIYNDFPLVDRIKIDGHDIDIISNIAIYESVYTLGVGGDYRRLLNGLMNVDISYIFRK